MSSVLRPQGRRPARVYWVRRLLALGVAVLLVVGIQRLLSFDGPPATESDVAATTVGAPFELPTVTLPSLGSDMVIKPGRRKAELPAPEGECDAADVTVTPLIEAAHVGQPVQIILEFTTTTSPACSFDASSASVAVNISTLSTDTAASELLWTTQDCPAALAETTVVARRTVPGRAVAQWAGRRSDERCSMFNPWVLPGDYVVEAAVLGGTETGEQEFEVEQAEPKTITSTATPTQTPTSSGSGTATPESESSESSESAGTPRSQPTATSTSR